MNDEEVVSKQLNQKIYSPNGVKQNLKNKKKKLVINIVYRLCKAKTYTSTL